MPVTVMQKTKLRRDDVKAKWDKWVLKRKADMNTPGAAPSSSSTYRTTTPTPAGAQTPDFPSPASSADSTVTFTGVPLVQGFNRFKGLDVPEFPSFD